MDFIWGAITGATIFLVSIVVNLLIRNHFEKKEKEVK